MSNLSTMPITRNCSPSGARMYHFQAGLGREGMVLHESASTTCVDKPEHGETSTATNSHKEIIPLYPRLAIDRPVESDAAVIQLWEGRVLDIDPDNQVMQVLLTAKLGQIPEHTAEIELQWVSEQDRDLVVPGAVFYLTLYKQTRRGSIKNSQELRFRRRPAWTKRQVQKIYAEADLLLGKMQLRPSAV